MPITHQKAINEVALNYLFRATKEEIKKAALLYLAQPLDMSKSEVVKTHLSFGRVSPKLLGIEMLYLLEEFGYGCNYNRQEGKVTAMEILVAHASSHDDVENILQEMSKKEYKLPVYDMLAALLSILDNPDVYPAHSWVNSRHIAVIVKALLEIVRGYKNEKINKQFEKMTAVEHAKLLALLMTYDSRLISHIVICNGNLLDINSLNFLKRLFTDKAYKAEYVVVVIQRTLLYLSSKNPHAELARLFVISRWLADRKKFPLSLQQCKLILQEIRYDLLEELFISQENQEVICNLMHSIISQYDILNESTSRWTFWRDKVDIKAEFSKFIRHNEYYQALKATWERVFRHLQIIEKTFAAIDPTLVTGFIVSINELFASEQCNCSLRILLQKLVNIFSSFEINLRGILKADKIEDKGQKTYVLALCKYLETVIEHTNKIDFTTIQPNLMPDKLEGINTVVLGVGPQEIMLAEISLEEDIPSLPPP